MPRMPEHRWKSINRPRKTQLNTAINVYTYSAVTYLHISRFTK